MRGMFGAGAEVFVRAGQLAIRLLTPVPPLYRAFPLHPDNEEDPDVFRLDLSGFGLGSMRVVFGRDSGMVTRLHLEVMPLTLHKRPAASNPRPWATRVLAALAVVTAAGVVRGRRRRR